MEITTNNLYKAIVALRQCAKENKGKQTDTGGVVVSDLCTDVADYLEASLTQAGNTDTVEGVKKKFNKVQEILDSLQDTDATFMFIGHEGNHFVLSGNPIYIQAQILFSMIRYPIVKDIIKACAERFEELNDECGEDVRNVKMDHLIERNSGNKEG